MKIKLTTVAVLVAALGAVGCGGSSGTLGSGGGGGGTAFLRGKVTEQPGNQPFGGPRNPGFVPLANAPVQVVDLDTELVVANATTDAEGNYAVTTTLPEGNYVVQATGRNDRLTKNVVTIDPDEAGVTLDLSPITTIAARAAVRQFRILIASAAEAGLARTIRIEVIADEFLTQFEEDDFELPDFDDEDAVDASVTKLVNATAPMGVYGGTISGGVPGRIGIAVFNGDEAKILIVPPSAKERAVGTFRSFATEVNEKGTIVVSSEKFKLHGVIAGGFGTGVWKGLNPDTGIWETGTWDVRLQTGGMSGAFEVQFVDAVEALRPLSNEEDLDDLAFIFDDNAFFFHATSADGATVMGLGTVNPDGLLTFTVCDAAKNSAEGTGTLLGDDVNLSFVLNALEWEVYASRYTDFGRIE